MNKITALTALAAACVALGTEASVADDKLIVAGQDLSLCVRIDERDVAARRRNAWDRSAYVPELVQTVVVGVSGGMRGRYENTKLPPRKDGSRAWDRAAHLLVREAGVRNRAARAEEAKNANLPAVQALLEELRYTSGGQLTLTASPAGDDRPVLLKASMYYPKAVTLDQARIVFRAFQEAGLL